MESLTIKSKLINKTLCGLIYKLFKTLPTSKMMTWTRS
jgi:hypothetical protein